MRIAIDRSGERLRSVYHVHDMVPPTGADIPVSPRRQRYLAARSEWDGIVQFNLGRLLMPTRRLAAAPLEQAVRALSAHHDALRLRVTPRASGYVYTLAPVSDASRLEVIDLSRVPPDDRGRQVTASCERLQRTLNIITGPVIRVVLFELGESQRLLVLVSHTLCDGVSMRILLNDLATAYLQASEGATIQLPTVPTSYSAYLRTKHDYGASPAFQEDLAVWQALPWERITSLPAEAGVDPATLTSRTVVNTLTELDAADAEALLRVCRQRLHCAPSDILLAAMALTAGRMYGERVLSLQTTHHGRADTVADLNLSRTCGNLVTCIPLIVDLRESPDLLTIMRTVQVQIVRAPHHGAMWEWLPAVMTDTPALTMNVVSYLPGTGTVAEQLFTRAPESLGQPDDPDGPLWGLISCTALNSPARFQLRWHYTRRLFQTEDVDRFSREVTRSLRLVALAR
jgi:hypothetical protein